jgi:mono/diheme cytochrome c family protein
MSSVLRSAGVLAIAIAGVALAPVTAGAQTTQATKTAPSAVTFAKDIAPIFQKSCQGCHRPGQMAPMSLLTYQDVRPWARSIKQKVAERQMPPWGIDPHVGIQSFKNDPSLREDEIEKITKWVDAGAPLGNIADMPKPREFDDSDRWHIGKPDLIVTSPPHTVPAEASDWWGSYYVETGLTEDRYIKAIESKPGKTAVVHHLLTYAVDADATGDSNGDDSSGDAGEFLNEFAVGKNGDLFPEGTGRLLRAGSKIKVDFHYHSVGKEIVDQSQLGIVLYPKGYVPKHIVYSKQLGQPTEPLDIPGGSTYVRSDGYTRFNKAGRITAFQPHMHTRGKRQCIELIYPDNKVEQISCADWSFNWHLVSVYADDVAPIYPAGTVLHVITWHDNSPSKGNPDPRNWVGSGNRTIDEMGFAWITWYDYTDEEYQAEFEARKGVKKITTSAGQPQ